MISTVLPVEVGFVFAMALYSDTWRGGVTTVAVQPGFRIGTAPRLSVLYTGTFSRAHQMFVYVYRHVQSCALLSHCLSYGTLGRATHLSPSSPGPWISLVVAL